MLTVERYTEREFLDAKFPDGEPVVEGLLYKGQNVLFVAPQKSAKTMFSQQLALAVAHGVPFLKWGIHRPQRVLAILCEGTNDELQDIMRRQTRALGLEEEGCLTVVRTPYLHLNTEQGEGTLRALLETEHPDLLILDPFYRLHKGSVNDDDSVSHSTGVLNNLQLQYGHATWMPHHEHRARHDAYGMTFEDAASKYAGSWALSAWCSSMYGFQFSMKKKTAALSAHFERRPRLGDTVSLTLEDVKGPTGTLLFHVGIKDRLATDIVISPEKLFGKGMREAARDYGQDRETFRKILQELQQEGHLVLVPGGPGRETMIGAVA